MRRRALLSLLLGAALMVSACGDSDEPATTPSGSYTVEGALDLEGSSVITVTGFLHIDESGPKVCSSILESFPPQCGEPAIFLVDFDLGTVPDTETAEGVTWAEGYAAQLQRVDGSTFRVVMR